MFVISFLKTISTAFTASDGVNHNWFLKGLIIFELWRNSNELLYLYELLANRDI